jgi:hypothetical protein
MRKIVLDVEQLQVESFATDAERGEKGTVHGREVTMGQYCGYTVGQGCATVQTGNANCPGCQNSGNASCVWCQPDTGTCQDCSWTNGDGAQCYW